MTKDQVNDEQDRLVRELVGIQDEITDLGYELVYQLLEQDRVQDIVNSNLSLEEGRYQVKGAIMDEDRNIFLQVDDTDMGTTGEFYLIDQFDLDSRLHLITELNKL